jgi:hypothetical protein
MTDQKLLHDAPLMKVNVWMCSISLLNHGTVSNVTIVNCFQKCGFNLNQTNGGGDAIELGIAEDHWDQLKADISFQEYVSCNNVIMCEVQTSEQMTDEKFTSDVSKEEEWEEEDNGGKSELPATFLSVMEGIDTVRKHLMKFDVNDNTMAALNSIKNEVCRVQ